MQLFVSALVLFLLGFAPLGKASDLVITNARIYPAPDTKPIERGVVVVRDGRIIEVGSVSDIRVSKDAQVIDADGHAVTAGFWNSHVHFTEPQWMGAAGLSAARLEAQFRDMFGRYGFTSVVDTGSDPRNTGPLRARVDSGKVAGPRILTAGAPLYPPDGIPYYLSTLPAEIRALLSQPDTPQQAADAVRRAVQGGADVIKLFTGSWVEANKPAKPMPLDVARAAVDEAHRHGKLVFTHPSDVTGLKIAMQAGVDVLAHAVEDTRGLDAALLEQMRERGMVMVPTLKLFSDVDDLDEILREVGDYRRSGGAVWFGTDVGFLEDYDPSREYELLQQAGLGFGDILGALTTGPAAQLPGGKGHGRLEAGAIADIVVFDGDPARDPTAWTRVRYTLRDGNIIFDAAARE